MNIRIVYHSQTGNTKKIAEAIAGEVHCIAEPITVIKSPVFADILFIGAAVYATYDHGIDPVVKNFINQLDTSKVGRAVLFCTGFSRKAIVMMSEILLQKRIKVHEKHFYCKGKLFLIFNFGHPNAKDITDAKRFAKEIAS